MKSEPPKPTALMSGKFSAPASYERTDVSPSGQSAAAVPTQRKWNVEAADIVALGVLVLALAASLIAIIIAIGFVFGRVQGGDAFKIIGACVGGSTISGIVAALLGRKL
jgi:hypothetical protein